ncbi:MAG: hypothetical protein PHD04_03295, partial [Candidatus Pacebacteria bacterium]|nr:hypothetical protein [Candidatus Paceibacterota bacterium]
MNLLFNEKFIPTKDAGELSGYHSDYLARLARSGKIIGKKVGRNWFVETDSLMLFLSQQDDRKTEYARALALAREKEYRAHHSVVTRATKALTTQVPVAQFVALAKKSVRGEAFALATALFVVSFGAIAAQAAIIPQIAERALALADETATGFSQTFVDVPYAVARRVANTADEVHEIALRVALANERVTANMASLALAEPDLSPLVMALDETAGSRIATERGGQTVVLHETVDAPVLTVADLRVFASDALAAVASPADAYRVLGEKSYEAIVHAFAGYRSLIDAAGDEALALGASTRDMLPTPLKLRRASATIPQFVNKMNLAIGESVISASQAAIRAETTLAYGTAAAAPVAARATVALIGNTGDALAGATSRAPALAQTAFLYATEAPARLAPAIAQAVFDAEYAAARPFIAATSQVTEGYLASIKDIGNVAYSISAEARLPHMNMEAVQDAYLGAIGNIALALETASRMPSVAAAIAALQPVLSPAEHVALTTYQSLHGLFSSTTNALASLFAPASRIAVSSPPASSSLPSAPARSIATTSKQQAGAPSSIAKIPAYSSLPPAPSYPTYVTTLNGVSVSDVTQLLASERSSILATVSGMIQPVSSQVATNIQTIQMVNKIEDLTGLIVRNGDFRGGTFTGGSFTGGFAVSARTGDFEGLTVTGVTTLTTLAAGATTLATTTVTGDVTLSGILTASTKAVAPYFVATDALATSTFAGGFTVGTDKLVIDSTTGRIGIGTTSPSGTLAVEGDVFFTGTTTLTGADKGITFTGTGNHDITATGGTLRIGSNTIIGNIQALDSTVDIGTPSTRFDKIYANEVNASTIVGTLTAGNLTAETFSINSDNLSVDAENSYLSFHRGTVTPNALLTWNAAGNAKRFEFNQPLYIENASASTTLTTLDLKAVAGQTADLLRVASSSGTALFTVTAAGNVGIGTTNPGQKLSIQVASGNAVGMDLRNQDGTSLLTFASDASANESITATGQLIIRSGASNPLIFQTGGANTRMSIDLSGNISMGTVAATTSITGGLTVGTSQFVVQQTSGNVGVGSTTPWGQLSVNPNGITGPAFVIGSSTATNFIVTNGGNVGIGTANPLAKVAINTGANNQVWIGQDTSATSYNTISLNGNLGDGTSIGITGGGALANLYMNAPAGGDIILRPNGVTAGASNETNISAGLLKVYGTAGASLQALASTGMYGYVRLGSGSTLWDIATKDSEYAGAFQFRYGGAVPQVVIQTGGNVGIGTTNPGDKLTVNGTGTFGGFGVISIGDGVQNWNNLTTNADGSFLLGVNLAYSTPNTTPSLITPKAHGRMAGAGIVIPGNASFASSGLAPNDIGFLTTPEGAVSAGAAYTRSPSMVIKASGNVGIGTTTPQYKLDVNGDVNVAAGSAYKYNGVNIITASTTLGNYFSGGAGNLTMTGGWNTANGYQALYYNTTGGHNTANGFQALFSNTTGSYNVASGDSSLAANTTGLYNVASGWDSLLNNISGSGNSAYGHGSLALNTIGNNNTAIGHQSLISNTTGSNNVSVGYDSFLYNKSATSSIAIGHQAARGTAAYNNQGGVYLGYQSGYSAATGSDYNTLLGYQSGYGVTTGARNVLIGQSTIAASYNQVTTGSNNIAIGNDVAVASPTASNQLNIGNLIYGTGLSGTGATLSTGNIGIGTTTPPSKLSVQGTIAVSSGTVFYPNQSWQINSYDGANGKGVGIGYTPDNNGNAIQGLINGSNGNLSINPYAGNVGIGTTNPGGKLEVVGDAGANSRSVVASVAMGASGNAGSYVIKSTYDTIGGIYDAARMSYYGSVGGYANATNYLGLDIATGADTWATKLAIVGNGNVGIGTTSPSQSLSVQGNAYVSGSSFFGGAMTATSSLTINGSLGNFLVKSTGAEMEFSRNSTNYIRATDASGSFQFGTGGVDGRLTILATGNVGIGTTTPDYRLHVNGDVATAGRLYFTSPNTSPAYIQMTSAGGNSESLAIWTRYGDYTKDFEIQQRSIFLAQSTTGRVSIGTTNVGSRLNVNGGVSIGSSYTATAAPTDGMIIQGDVGIGTTSPWGKLSVTGTGTGTGLGFVFANSANDPKVFIQDNGNVGMREGAFLALGGGGSTAGVGSTGIYVPGGTTMRFQFNGALSNARVDSVGYAVDSSSRYAWTSGDIGTALDSGLSRLSAGKIGVGNGAVGDYSGTLIAGSVGIGTTSPWKTLSVTGDTVVTSSLTIGTGVTAATGVIRLGNQQYISGINFVSGTTNRMIGMSGVGNKISIDADGSGTIFGGGVNIPNSAPLFGVNAAGNAFVPMVTLNSNNAIIYGDTSSGGNLTGLIFNVTGGEAMRIISGGNVSIGTTSPWGKLSVTGTGAGNAFVVADHTNTPKFVVTDSGY